MSQFAMVDNEKEEVSDSQLKAMVGLKADTRESDMAAMKAMSDLVEQLKEQLAEKNSELEAKQSYIDSLLNQADQAVNTIDELRRDREDLFDELVHLRGAQPGITRVQVVPSIHADKLAKDLNDGWGVLHLQFSATGKLSAVLTREEPSTSPTQGASAGKSASALATLRPASMAAQIKRDGVKSVLQRQNEEIAEAGRQTFLERLAQNKSLNSSRTFPPGNIVSGRASQTEGTK